MISFLTPTRQRPEMCNEFIQSVLSTTASVTNVELLFYVDNDDPCQAEYYHLQEKYLLLPVTFLVGESQRIGISWNMLAHHAHGNLLFLGNDDLLCVTPDWDLKVEAAFQRIFPDAIGLMWPNDTINGAGHAAFPIVSQRWVNIVGYYTPLCFEFFFHDTFLFDIGKRLNRVHYLPEVTFRHRHWTVTGEKDATTRRHREDTQQERNRRDTAMFTFTSPLRCAASRKLAQAIERGTSRGQGGAV